MTSAFQIIRAPMNTEKARRGWVENAKGRMYTFLIEPTASKEEIKKAIEAAFHVKVAAVRTQTRKGKFRRKRAQGGWCSDTKRALVTLAPGDKIAFFDGI